MFNILELIIKKLKENNIPVLSMSHNPLRIDFIENEPVNEEQIQLAENIAYEFLDNEEYHKTQWEESQKRIITSEKAALLVDLLIKKGIITDEELNSIF